MKAKTAIVAGLILLTSVVVSLATKIAVMYDTATGMYSIMGISTNDKLFGLTNGIMTNLDVTAINTTNAWSAATPVLASADGTNFYWTAGESGGGTNTLSQVLTAGNNASNDITLTGTVKVSNATAVSDGGSWTPLMFYSDTIGNGYIVGPYSGIGHEKTYYGYEAGGFKPAFWYGGGSDLYLQRHLYVTNTDGSGGSIYALTIDVANGKITKLANGSDTNDAANMNNIAIATNGMLTNGQANVTLGTNLYLLGNVGIGTNNPASVLDVNGTAMIRGVATLVGTAYFMGKVGVGTNTPAAILHLMGNDADVRFSTPSGGDVAAFRATGDAFVIESFSDKTNGHIYLRPVRTGDVISNNTVFLADQGGDVAVGVPYTSVDHVPKLDVGGDIRVRGDQAALLFYRTTTPTDIAKINYDQAAGSINIQANTKNFLLKNGSSFAETFRVTSAGCVGIGTNNPATLLHIEGGGLRQSSEGIVFSETATDNMGLESVTYPVTGQTYSVWLGYRALNSVGGVHNSAVGYTALFLSAGSYNSAVGSYALRESLGSYNNAQGYSALYQSPGSYNSAVGYQAGYRSGGTSNLFLGANCAYTTSGTNYYTNAIAIGAGATPLGNNSMVLGNVNTTNTTIYGGTFTMTGLVYRYYLNTTNYVSELYDASNRYVYCSVNGVVTTNSTKLVP